MRNSAFRTVTTNSRGVKSSLTRMTLCRRGRSVLVLTLVFGLVTASIIPAAPPDLSLPLLDGFAMALARIPLPGRLRNRQFAMASLQRRHRGEIGDGIRQIGV